MRRSPRRQNQNSASFSTLPDETIVEILSYVEVHELLCVAWTCRRWQRAALDGELWRRTRFEACDALTPPPTPFPYPVEGGSRPSESIEFLASGNPRG